MKSTQKLVPPGEIKKLKLQISERDFRSEPAGLCFSDAVLKPPKPRFLVEARNPTSNPNTTAINNKQFSGTKHNGVSAYKKAVRWSDGIL